MVSMEGCGREAAEGLVEAETAAVEEGLVAVLHMEVS